MVMVSYAIVLIITNLAIYVIILVIRNMLRWLTIHLAAAKSVYVAALELSRLTVRYVG